VVVLLTAAQVDHQLAGKALQAVVVQQHQATPQVVEELVSQRLIAVAALERLAVMD
jgi:hypothetical protein